MSKVVIIGDMHFGVHNGSKLFLDFQRKFLDEIIKHCVDNNISEIWLTGDVFEVRKSTNTEVLDFAKEHFFDKVQELGILVRTIVGNHDMFYKNTITPNAISVNLSSYDNIVIYDKVTEHKINDKNSVLMVPWICRENEEEIMDAIRTSECNVLLGHLEVKGARMEGAVCTEGLELSVFENYDLALSGHFHCSGMYGNVKYVGTAGETSWGDYGETKGFHVFDTETLNLEFHANDHRLYYKIMYQEGKDMDAYLKNDYTYCFVRVIVEDRTDFKLYEKWLMKLELKQMKSLKCIEPFGERGEEDSDVEFTGDIDAISTSQLVEEYIADIYPEKKTKLNQMAQGLLAEALKVMS
jgi:DNA repair exonuclease SbcCD nuclease subunit